MGTFVVLCISIAFGILSYKAVEYNRKNKNK